MIIISVKLTIEYVGMNYELLFCMSWEQLLCFFLKYLQQEKPLLWYDILNIKSKKQLLC
jgi:hypothetical protein